MNPSQSAAPSEGWTSFAGGGGYGSNNGTGCGPGSPMYAILSTDAAVGVGANETLQYTPPGGSTLIGGSVDVSIYADGGGYNASGTAVAYSPQLRLRRLGCLLPMRVRPDPLRERHQRLRRRARDSQRPRRQPLPQRRMRRRIRLRLQLGRQRRRLVAGAAVVGEPPALQRSDAERQRRRRNAAEPKRRRHGGTHAQRCRSGRPRRVSRDRPDRRQNRLLGHTEHQRRKVRGGRHERRRADVRLQPALPRERVGRPADQHDDASQRPAHLEGHGRGRRRQLERSSTTARSRQSSRRTTHSARCPALARRAKLRPPRVGHAERDAAQAGRRSCASASRHERSPAPTATARFERRGGCSTARVIRSLARRWTCCSRSAARRAWRSSGTPRPVQMGRSQRRCPAAPTGRSRSPIARSPQTRAMPARRRSPRRSTPV